MEKFFIEIENTTIQKFESYYRDVVYQKKEFRIEGYVGDIQGNSFWVNYFPKSFNLKHIVEFYSPMVMEGHIYKVGKGILIEYYFKLNKNIRLIRLTSILLFLLIFLTLWKKIISFQDIYIGNVLLGIVISLILFLWGWYEIKIWTHMPNYIKEHLEKLLLDFEKQINIQESKG